MAFNDWLKALQRTRQSLAAGISRVFSGGHPAAAAIDELEASLLEADIPVRLVNQVADRMRIDIQGQDGRQTLRSLLLENFATQTSFDWKVSVKPTVVLIVGVNGSGKTTTAAKLAKMAAAHHLKPLLGAADTFRAAGSDQLRLWAARVGCDVVGGKQGADSAAVAFDALQAAAARGSDIVFIDTAGRMHTKRPLMEELVKIKRSLAKGLPGAPHHTWMVLDATLGNNALQQAESFHRSVGLEGIIVSKLDGSARAGFLTAVAGELRIPILFAGLGEGADDLTPFDPHDFVDALLGKESEADSHVESR